MSISSPHMYAKHVRITSLFSNISIFLTTQQVAKNILKCNMSISISRDQIIVRKLKIDLLLTLNLTDLDLIDFGYDGCHPLPNKQTKPFKKSVA